jgi:sulfate transport system ATP-binding protein
MGFIGQVNVFHGRLPGVAPHDADLHHGGRFGAIYFVRPSDVRLQPLPSPGRAGPEHAATVSRIHAAGPLVRIELLGRDAQLITAEVTQERFRELELLPQQQVQVEFRSVHRFDP